MVPNLNFTGGNFNFNAYALCLIVGSLCVFLGLFVRAKDHLPGISQRINTFTFIVITAAVCSRLTWGILNPHIFSEGFAEGFDAIVKRGGFSAHGTILGVAPCLAGFVQAKGSLYSWSVAS